MLPAAVGATLVGAVAYCELPPHAFACLPLLPTLLLLVCAVALAPSQPAANLARADSNAGAQKKKMLVRRHSSGDHAFLPNRQETAAKNLAARGGVQAGSMHDSEVNRQPRLACRARPVTRLLTCARALPYRQGLSLPSTHERHSDGRPRT